MPEVTRLQNDLYRREPTMNP